MKSFLLLLLAGTLLPFTARAQAVCEEDLCIPREIILKTTLTGPLQVASYVALGVEVPVYKQIAAQVEAIYIYKYLRDSTQLAGKRLSFGTKIDLKYYIPKSTTLRIYTGPSITYRKMYTHIGHIEWRTEKDELGLDTEMPYLVMDNATEAKNTTTDILWQVGIQPFILKHFALNLYTGAGLGLEKYTIKSGQAPSNFNGKTRTYFSSILGLQLGFAF